MKIFCDECEKVLKIGPEDLPEYLVLNPKDGTQIVMCASCQVGPEHVAADVANVAHTDWCIGGDKGPCNCGAKQKSRAGT